MVFNIGNQQGGVVNNVAGDQTVHGGQSGHLTADGQDVRGLVGELRTAVEQAQLPPAMVPEVRAELNSWTRRSTARSRTVPRWPAASPGSPGCSPRPAASPSPAPG
ncbi:hypothetical protein ACFQ0M_36510 [Kitasatospora aburaviensis]